MNYLASLPLTCMLTLAGCQDAITQVDTRSSGSGPGVPSQGANQNPAGGPILRLTWEPSTGTVTEYHVFGLAEEKNSGGTEFASLDVVENNQDKPFVQIDLSKVALPKSGKVCFYVTAENKNLSSLASEVACLAL